MSTAVTASRPADRVPTRDAVMGQIGKENFPVASRLLGRRTRRQLVAIYGFARLVDDIGDEAPGNRLTLLDWLDGEVTALYAGREPEHAAMRFLGEVLRNDPLPEGPFRRLIEANRRDQTMTRYATFDDLLGYCQLSAAPVGELVLHVFGAATPERVELSDRVCAGLQVTEHLQDIREDYARGRIYLPQEDLRRFGCEEGELATASASSRLRELIAFEVERARELLRDGAPLARSLGPRARIAVAGFIAGGRAALAGIEQAGYDTLKAPAPRPRRAFAIAWTKAVRGR